MLIYIIFNKYPEPIPSAAETAMIRIGLIFLIARNAVIANMIIVAKNGNEIM